MGHKILLVEDDPCFGSVLKSYLELSDYDVIHCTNGVDGFEAFRKEKFDLCLLDVMMPEMDGIELCKKIKTNEKTCHIPVILLTAKTAIEQRIEGLEVGADSYIPKPFNVTHLRTRVRKLIELRRSIKEKYEGKHELREEDIKIKSVDEKMLEKIDQIIKEQISDPNLSVETLSRHRGKPLAIATQIQATHQPESERLPQNSPVALCRFVACHEKPFDFRGDL